MKAGVCASQPPSCSSLRAGSLPCCTGGRLLSGLMFSINVIGGPQQLQDLTPEYFAREFETPRKPVVITGALDKWAAQQQWTPAALLQQFKDHKFKVWLELQQRRPVQNAFRPCSSSYFWQQLLLLVQERVGYSRNRSNPCHEQLHRCLWQQTSHCFAACMQQ